MPDLREGEGQNGNEVSRLLASGRLAPVIAGTLKELPGSLRTNPSELSAPRHSAAAHRCRSKAPRVLATRRLSLVYPREARLARPVQAVIHFVLDVAQENAVRIVGTAS